MSIKINGSTVVVSGRCRIAAAPFSLTLDYENYTNFCAGIIPAIALGDDAARWLEQSISPQGWKILKNL